ncbi:MAG: MBOAT family O-acyltransferase [Oscillospiraceae bacterium]
MVFNSYIFVLFFLPITVMGYFIINKFKQYQLSKIYLILMSFWFYGYFNPSYLPIIIFSILVNYLLSKFLIKSDNKIKSNILLFIGLAFNIGILIYFKYYDFFISNVNFLFKSDFNLLNLLLPLGISFFTFQQLSFVIDSYKKTVPDYNILDYSLFVTFFPQLVAGPIVLHNEIVPQFADEQKKTINYENLSKGFMAFSFGLAKKVLIADVLGAMVTYGYSDIAKLNTTNTIIVILAYTFQIYFDFSGYCDIATGVGLMFNIDIPMNFNSPYRSFTIVEFWKRWHITLTRFFTTYIYIPLGGSRKGILRKNINIFIVFLVSGLWHGASWSFILWGALHGVFNILTRVFEKQINKANPVLNWIVTFSFINLSWVFFRAESISAAFSMFKNLVLLNFGAIKPEIFNAIQLAEFNFIRTIISLVTGEHFIITHFYRIILILFFAFCFFAVLQMKNTNERIKTFKPTITTSLVSVFLLIWSIISFTGVSTFLYFNF